MSQNSMSPSSLRTQRNPQLRKGLTALWIAGILGGLAQSLAGSAGSLVAGDITGSDRLAGLPQSLLVVGAGASAPVMAMLAPRIGRRRALAAGAGAACGGCLILLAGASASRLSLLLIGSAFLGAGNTAVMLGRYAAADLVGPADRARAMASVLTATTLGAVAGPNLLGPTGRLAEGLGLSTLAGPYLISSAVYLATTRVLAAGHEPPAAITEAPGTGTAGARSALPALPVLALTNLVMVATMTMTPLQLRHHGMSLTGIGLVVGLHIGAMFAPSPISGRIVARVGALRAAAAAGGLLILATTIGAAGADSVLVVTVAVALLGLGWNLGVLAGSAMLTDGAGQRERFRRESWGEIGMGIAAGIGGLGSGLAMAGAGYAWLSIGGAGCAAGLVLLAAAIRRTGAWEGGAP